jgi:DNA invertase Pin-like site-specific DNA recombinase
MSVYGYCRISTPKQSIDLQIRNIRQEFPNATIIQEAYSGTTLERKEWSKLYKAAKAQDTIVFDSVSRMSRTADEGFSVYQELYSRGVNLVFLKERHIDTATYQRALNSSIPMTGTAVDCILEGINKYLLELAKEQIRLAFIQSEKEVEDLHLRTREGIQTARLAGKQIGQREGAKLNTKKSAQMKPILLQHCKEFGGSLNDTEVMRLTGLARNTYYKYKSELRAAQ